MGLKHDLEKSLKEAMLSKETRKRDTVRMALSSLKQLEKDSGDELTEIDVINIIQKEIKTKQETISEAKKANREEMIPPLLAEIKILEEFLPKELSENELKKLVKSIIYESGAESMKDMGKIMSEAITRSAGGATNERISKTVRGFLQE